MSGVNSGQGSELQGLPAVLSATLASHPDWEYDGDDVVCAGDDCDWVKPPGKGVSVRWRKHQVFFLQLAIAEWYNNPPVPLP